MRFKINSNVYKVANNVFNSRKKAFRRFKKLKRFMVPTIRNLIVCNTNNIKYLGIGKFLLYKQNFLRVLFVFYVYASIPSNTIILSYSDKKSPNLPGLNVI